LVSGKYLELSVNTKAFGKNLAWFLENLCPAVSGKNNTCGFWKIAKKIAGIIAILICPSSGFKCLGCGGFLDY
jgi:hypothetical protein